LYPTKINLAAVDDRKAIIEDGAAAGIFPFGIIWL
jgi:hypothetical protein